MRLKSISTAVILFALSVIFNTTKGQITQVDFTRYYNNQQVIGKITTDSVYLIDNVGREKFKYQRVSLENEYKDWHSFSKKLKKILRKCKIIDSIPKLFATSNRSVETKIYITKGNRIYFYSWSEEDKKNLTKEDSHFIFDNCFLKDEEICSIYYRLIK